MPTESEPRSKSATSDDRTRRLLGELPDAAIAVGIDACVTGPIDTRRLAASLGALPRVPPVGPREAE